MEYGCQHYRRKCKLVAPCCGEVFWCRHCHNEAKHDNPECESERHLLDRKSVSEIECAICNTRQPISNYCISCGIQFGQYYCPECRFFDDDTSKEHFHCEKCGICRVGGRNNFFHCDTCNCCYHNDLQDHHVCVPNSTHSNCPVCQEFLFHSIRELSVLKCGHPIHSDCLQQLVDYGIIKCPICSKTMFNMSLRWRNLDAAIAAAPMPREHRRKKASILCNDCNITTKVPFHVLGNRCRLCNGYNTIVCSMT
eukprot:g1674.t1